MENNTEERAVWDIVARTISVIVPAYNVVAYIEEAVNSLLEQSLPFFEIIIVNDGSTDATLAVLEQYAANPRVAIYTTHNQGLGLTRNFGRTKAHGDYIYFFDADDIAESNTVELLTSTIQNVNNVDLVFFSGASFCDKSMPSAEYYKTQNPNEFIRGASGFFGTGCHALQELRRTGRFSPSACLYLSRRELWGDDLAFLPIIHEDAELALRLCLKAKTTCILNTVLFHRRVRQGSIMTQTKGRTHLQGYATAIRSAITTCNKMKHGGKTVKNTAAQYLKDMTWLYLDSCRQAKIKPGKLFLGYLFLHGQTSTIGNFSKYLLPAWLYVTMKKGQQLLPQSKKRAT